MQPTHNDIRNAYQQEWITLQNQYDSYEKVAVAIKLVGTALVVVLLLAATEILAVAIILLFWVQEAIWKTFQGRIETRLLETELMLAQDAELMLPDAAPMQFNRYWLSSRPGGMGLLVEYVKSALRPTVAMHYVLMLLVTLVFYFAAFKG
ncbi:conserved hypothetical protein [Paraglaciecola sp. T6c]|uniref:hypothetical protein n=1 Tax=Pseudoalteromonas atlantica (strain T6c / ATCC BAA-1087) TaxID=3042615 RepID=UPI00005C6CE4|nr:hypothetical protein [Paraglaciecola sp. T6c]ABG38974.1 conserved hypothetical protein [Paraglaciecola sp. T6c]